MPADGDYPTGEEDEDGDVRSFSFLFFFWRCKIYFFSLFFGEERSFSFLFFLRCKIFLFLPDLDLSALWVYTYLCHQMTSSFIDDANSSFI